MGPLRIAGELTIKGVAPDLIKRCVAEQAPRWLDEARSQYRKRFGEMDAQDSGERAKRARFLMQRGFPAEIVRRVLKSE